jgi:hypothetical protein
MPAFLGILEEFLEQDFIVRAPHRRGVLYL